MIIQQSDEQRKTDCSLFYNKVIIIHGLVGSQNNKALEVFPTSQLEPRDWLRAWDLREWEEIRAYKLHSQPGTYNIFRGWVGARIWLAQRDSDTQSTVSHPTTNLAWIAHEKLPASQPPPPPFFLFHGSWRVSYVCNTFLRSVSLA